MSGSKSIVFKYTYATSALKQNTVTVFGETATPFVVGQDYDENVIFKVPAASLSAFILYYNGVVPNGSVGSTELPSLRTQMGGVTNVPAYLNTAQYYLGDIVTFTPPGTTNASCYTLIRTTSVASDPVPTQGTTVAQYVGPVIGQNQFYQAFLQGHPPVNATTGVLNKAYWAISTIASGWTATVPYYTGDRVVYQGNVYQCISTNGLLDKTVTLLGTFGTGSPNIPYYGYDKSGIRYVLNVLPTNTNFWLYSALPAVPSSSHTFINWAQSDIGGLNSIDNSGGVIMKWDGSRPADLLPTATSGGILGGSGSVTFTFYTDDELNKVNTLLNLYNQNQNSFSLVNANAILAKLPASVIKAQTTGTSLEPDKQLAQLVNAGPRFTSPNNYNTVVQSIFEEAIANDMLYTTNVDGTRTKLNQLPIHGFPELLSGLETVKAGSTNAFAQGKASMGVYSVPITTAGTGYLAGSSGDGGDGTVNLVFAPPDTTGVTATATAQVLGGILQSVTITNPGSGYTKSIPAPSVSTAFPTNGTPAAFGSPTMTLVGVALTSFGGFYSNNQAITVAVQNPATFTGSVAQTLSSSPIAYTVTRGTNATIRTTLNSFRLVAPGSGYTSVPEIIVSGSTKLGGSLPTFKAVMGVNQISTRTGYTNIPVANLPLRVAVTGSTSTTCSAVTFTTPTVVLTVNSSTGFVVGDRVQVTGLAAAGNNGIFTITAVATGTITFTNSAGVTATSQTGTVSKNFATVNPVFYGTVESIPVTAGGSGYLLSDKITISAPYNGVSPVAATTITSSSTTGSVATATLSAFGSGFYTTPNVVVSPPTVTAAATAAIFNGSLRGPTLDTPADAFTITNQGTGYLNAPYVNVSPPPTSTTAIAVVVVNQFLGTVSDITIINPGVGYVTNPLITISAPGGVNNETAVAEAVIQNGSIIDFVIKIPGSGYTRTSPPSITIAPPPQSIQAQARAVVSNTGQITDIKLVNTVTSFTISSGAGYSAAPVVSIAPPGSGTTSTSSITAGVTTLAITSYSGSDIVAGDSITLTGMTTGNGTYTVVTATGAPTTSITFRNTVALTGTGTITKGVRATAEAIMQGTGSSQSVRRLIVLDPGSGYITAPIVTLTGAADTAATATAVIGLGGVGYTSVPSVGILGSTSFNVITLQGGSTSPFASTVTRATMVAVINNDAIGSVGSLAITNAGAGYTQAPTVTFIASIGRTAQASLSVNTSGQVTDVVIIDGGYGYGLAVAGGASEPINISVISSGGSGFGFGTPVIKYTLDRFAYLTTGSGYTSPPTTVITHYTGGGAYSATALTLAPKLSVVSIPTFRGVTGLRVVNGGTGYCQQDAVQIKNNNSSNLRLSFGSSPTGFNAGASFVMGGVIRSVTIGTTATSNTVAVSGSTVTLTVDASNVFTVGDTITTRGFVSAGNNGRFTIATIPSGTSITFTNALATAATSQTGFVTRGSGTGYSVGTNLTFSAPASGQGTPANGFISAVGSFGEILNITLTTGGFAYGFTTSGGAYTAEPITISVSGAGTGAILSVGTTPASITYDIIGFEFHGNSYGEYVTAPVVTVLGTATTVTSGSNLEILSPTYVALGSLSDPVLASNAQIVATLGVVPNPDAEQQENANSTAGIGLFASPQLRFDPPPQSTTALADAVVVNEAVNNFTITNGGYGYDFVPKVSIIGYGTGATGTAVMGVKQVYIASGGAGYAVGNVITVTAPSGSGGVTAKVRVTQVDVQGSILNTYISVEGSQYTSMPTVTGVTVSSANNSAVTPTIAATLFFYLGVVSVTLGAGGSSYIGLPSVVFESPNFTSATATMTAKTARIESLQLVTGGSGYTANQKCRLLGASAQTAPTLEDFGYMRVTTVSSGGAITGFSIGGSVGTVRITNGGSGYSSVSPPTVTFSGGGLAEDATTQAVATAVVSLDGSVTGFTFATDATSYGSGYTGVPTITIGAPTAGVTATAIATLDGGFDYRSGDELIVEGGIGGKVSVVNVSSTIADSRDVAITAGGSGYLSVPTISSFGGAQGIVLATSLKLYGVQIPPETYVNNGLFKDNDSVFANIPGSGVVQIGTLANANGAPTVTVTNSISNLSTFPSIIVSGSGTGTGLAAVATATLTTVTKGSVASVAVGSSFTVGTLTSTAEAVAGSQVLTFAAGLSVTARASLQPGMRITLASASGTGGVGPFVIAPNGISLNSNTNSTITILNSNTTAVTTGVSIEVTLRGGAFYNSAFPPTVTFTSPPTPVNAVGTATIIGGRLTGITITTAGSGYSTAPTISITRNTSDTTGVEATAEATLNATGGIESINVIGAGRNYTATPVITISPPPAPSTAQGTATVVGSGAGGYVTLVTVTSGGSGYTSAPTVTFSKPSLGSIVAYANCGLGEVQISSSVTGFAGNASVLTTRPSGPLQNPQQALIIPLKFREITGITGLTNIGVVGGTNFSASSRYYYSPGVFPLIAISAPALSTTATEAGNDATQLITNERSNGFTFATPQFQGWYGVNFNVGDTFQFLVKYTIAKAVVFVVDTDVTIPGLTTASSSITIGGVSIPLYNPSTGTGVGRELSTNSIVHTYMVTLKAS